MSKTPVTILEEICAKQPLPREKPTFTDISEANFTDPGSRFIIKCQALGYSSIGRGVTKKAAKHNSAENLLAKFNNKKDPWLIEEDDECDESGTPTAAGNCITDLLDYCVVKDLHKPEFKCISESGPSHCPTFVFECKLNSIIREGKAGIKQIAKQNAAKAVLDILKSTYPESEKKLVAINEPTEAIRKKVTSYHELKKLNRVEKMGTSLKYRHKFFRKQDQGFITSVTEILRSEDSDKVKYEKLSKELEDMQWNPKTEKLEDSELNIFKLEIEMENFTCSLMYDKEPNLYTEVIQYFNELMLVNVPDIFDASEGLLEEVQIEPLY